MALMLNAASCFCGVCRGGDRAPVGIIGGTYCPCTCHQLRGIARDSFIARRDKARKDLITAALSKRPSGRAG